MKHLYRYTTKCIQTLKEMDCPISENLVWEVNSRSKKRWGRCALLPDGGFEIQISSRLLEDNVPDDSLCQTIYHELLHTIPHGMTHKGEWLRWARKVNNKLGLNIQRTNSAESLDVTPITTSTKHLKYKYKVRCCDCGAFVYYKKASKIIQSVAEERGICYCGNCHSHNLTLEQI